MTSMFDHLARFFRSVRGLAAIAALLAWTFISIAPLHAAAEIPDDDEQDVLIRTALMTFNDANMTGNYSVLFAKSSKELQSQVPVEKMQTAFEPFRKNELFFEDVATAEYASYDKATLDNEGALVLAGVFKTDDMEVKYRLRFIQNNHAWKLLGINVDATRKKQ
ncbi:MAG: hypothetical protein AB1586_19190 [Pseudomonadota bacterium]